MGLINKKLLPIKAHFFFFLAAMGPFLPQLTVYGKELGISSVVMGSTLGVMPFIFLLAKPAFGLLVDVHRNYRKAIFLFFLIVTSLSYALLYFVPARFVMTYQFQNVSCPHSDTCNVTDFIGESQCNVTQRVLCKWSFENSSNMNFSKNKSEAARNGLVHHQRDKSNPYRLCLTTTNDNFECRSIFANITCEEDIETNTACLYKSPTFWCVMVLVSLGTFGCNVLLTLSDAICFDVIGDEFEYGKQRVWGSIGFGITALVSGYIVNYFSSDQLTYTPAFVIITICTIMDLLACIKLELPVIEAPKDTRKHFKLLLNNRHTIVFLIFASLAGILDGFTVYFLFWYLEDLAIATNTANIKLLEGLTVAAETLGAEVIFFYLSGTILARFGHAYSFSMCFIFYGLRLVLVSVIPSPWWIIPVEFVMQGCTYSLTYSTIVAYANAIAPEGMSATMQGIGAGLNDGLGYAIGGIGGGLLYSYIGGKGAFQVFSIIGVLCGVIHYILYKTVLQHCKDPTIIKKPPYLSPEDAATAVCEK